MPIKGQLEGDADSLLDTVLHLIKSRGVDPLYHISELVQNEIDAGATKINVTFFHKGKGNTRKVDAIIIDGNGFGFLESFEHYHKNITDSIKKKVTNYTERAPSGLSRGQFCLGIQGFRTICDELQLINLTRPGETPKVDGENIIVDPDFYKMFKNRKLILWADNRNVEIYDEPEFSEHRKEPGVTCLLKGVNLQIKAKDLTKYLSANKRSVLIANKNLHIIVKDELYEEEVKPVKFTGDELIIEQSHPKEGKEIKYSGLGKVKATLYFQKPRSGCKIRLDIKGEPIFFDITSKIPEFNCPPWNSDMVEGIIEYPYLTPLPTRNDIERDKVFWPAFIDIMKTLAIQVEKKIEEYEKQSQSDKNEELMRKLETILADVKRELEFSSWFDKKNVAPTLGPVDHIAVFPEVMNVPAYTTRKIHVRAYDNEDNILGEKEGVEFYWELSNDLGTIFAKNNGECVFKAGSTVGIITIIAKVKDTKKGTEFSENIETVITHPPANAGMLSRVKIEPPFSKLSLGDEKEYKAIAEDGDGNVILKNIEFDWVIVNDDTSGAKLNVNHGESVLLHSGKNLGEIKLQVTAYQNGRMAKDSALVIVVEKIKKKGRKPRPKNLGLPTPQDWNELEYPIRHSHLSDDGTILYYHTPHQDYKNAKAKGENLRQKYIIQLYAKELAIKECESTGSKDVGEKMLEVLSKIENHWY